MKRFLQHWVNSLLILLFVGNADVLTAKPPEPVAVSSLRFTENKGQVLNELGKVRQDILFTGYAAGVQFFLTRQGIIYNYSKVHQGKLTTRQVEMQLLGINPVAEILAERPTLDVQNYFSSTHPKGITGIKSYRKVSYKEIYPNIDFVLYTDGESLKYDFVVRPGGDVSKIRFTYKGNRNLRLKNNGSLWIINPLGKLIEGTPYSYQQGESKTIDVASRYTVQEGVVSFRLSAYDKTKTLIIDPAVAWATYYGGEGVESALSIKTDKAGNLYGVGFTRSNTRISQNGYTSTIPDASKKSGLIVKFNNQQQLVWATYFGIDCDINSIAINNDGQVFITGPVENGGSIPIVGSLKSVHAGGRDSFVAKFNAEGIPEWTTYYGGSKDENVQGIAVDGNGEVYITGYTTSSNDSEAIATAGAYRSIPYNPDGCNAAPNPNECFTNRDAFLVKFNTLGQRIWSTYYGGITSDLATGIAIDSESNIYIHGRTTSVLPIDAINFNNTIQTTRTPNDQNSDAFIAKFNTQGVRLWGTYFGGTFWDDIRSMTFDEQNNLYITGETQSNNLFSGKTGPGIKRHKTNFDYTGNPVMEAFIAKINRNYTVQWTTYYGGKRWDSGLKIGYNGKGSLYVVGLTESSTDNTTESISSGNLVSRYGLKNSHSNTSTEDAFIVKFDTSGVRIWGAYYGGSRKDIGHSLALAPDGKIYVSGITESDFTMPANTLYGSRGGNSDGYIMLLDDKDPVITSLFPAHQDTRVPVTANLIITFDEPILKGTGNISIKQGTNQVKVIDVSSAAVAVNGNTATIDLSTAGFTPVAGSAYQIEVSTSCFTNAIGNQSAGVSPENWQFTVVPDETAPLLVGFNPPHASVNQLYNIDLEIEFNEEVDTGNGTISIYRGSSIETIPSSHDSVVITGKKVIIKVPDFAFGENVKIAVDNKAFKDLAGNFFAGISAEEWAFTVQYISITPTTFSPISIVYDGSAIDPLQVPTVSIEISPNLPGTSVALYTRGISSGDTDWVKQDVPATDNLYSLTLPTDSSYHRNKMGIEYYFEVTPPAGYGNPVNSSRGIANIIHENGLEIPMQQGSKTENYRLISIPLTLQDSTIESVLIDDLENYNIEKWRLYRYENDETGYQEYSNAPEFNSLQTGRAYWILARKRGSFTSGKGATLPVSQDKPYVMQLKKGWNLIGNPYDMHVLWEDVREDSINKLTAPELGELFVYEGNGNFYNEQGNLMAYSGGFVRVEDDVTIRIPLLRNKPLNGGRMSAEKPLYNSGSLFEVNFTLTNKNMRYQLAGLGMHPLSKEGHDRYDRYLLPRFSEYTDIRFSSNTGKNLGFTKQMVPVGEEYTWEFTTETNQAEQLTELRWENYFSEPNGKQLYLYDVQQEIIVNMLDQNSYKFTPETSGLFRVFYGSSLYISKHLRPQRIKLNQNVPNPFRNETFIPFSLPDGISEYTVEVSVYNLSGVEIATIAKGKYQPGFHELKWNGRDKQGNPLPPGMYVAKLIVAEEKRNKEMYIRLIIQ